jgi:hypothetical protein
MISPSFVLAVTPFFILLGILSITLNKQPIYSATRKLESFKLLSLSLPAFLYGIWLIGLRSLDAGNDTARYVLTFENLSNVLSAHETGRYFYGNSEWLWWPLQSFFRPFFSARGWLIFNFTLVFLATWIFFRSTSKNLNFSSSIFVFVFFTFYSVYSGNIMRQALAVPIGALGFFLFLEGKRIGSIALIFIAVGLHWSAIIFFLAPIFLVSFVRSRAIVIVAPFAALLLSPFAATLIGQVVGAIGFQEISGKFETYFSTEHNSHVGTVWKTANFWICTVSSFAFLFFCPIKKEKTAPFLHSYILLLLIPVLLGVGVPDFSERYLPYIFMALPLIIASIVDRLRLDAKLKSSIYCSFFLSLAALVFSADSSMHTLGYRI